MPQITLTVNGQRHTLAVRPSTNLLTALRRLGYFSVKQGCDSGDCGICTVLVDGEPLRSCRLKAVEMQGRAIETVEGLAPRGRLHPLQEAFVEAGAIQCGFCTPGQLLTAKALLDRNPNPSEADIRAALNGVLCRCTGYAKIVHAVQLAAAKMQGQPAPRVEPVHVVWEPSQDPARVWEAYHAVAPRQGVRPALVVSPPDLPPTRVVGQGVRKVDAVKLIQGRPVFTADMPREGMLYAALLTSPHPHARIKRIDTSRAEALPGVRAVLTYKDIPRVKYASGGQSYPNPRPYDQVVLDHKVRHVGDRVAVVAADDPDTARRALRLIEVEYEVLPHVLDPLEAMRDGAPVIHDEEDTTDLYDREHNIVHHLEAEVGDREAAWARADFVFEREYRTSQQQHVNMEPHVALTYWDEDDRLVVVSSTQVPFHIRRMLAPLLGLPEKRIRVRKPRLGGGFGNKQELVVEDLAAWLTIKTGRPVLLEYTRYQEFVSTRSRHPHIMRFKVGVTKEGEVVATELRMITDAGAYGTHSLTVPLVAGLKSLSLYNAPYARFELDVVYTNKPTPGAFRGYGATEAFFGMETIMAEIAAELGWDVVAFKRRNWVKKGEALRISKVLGEGPAGHELVIRSTGLEEAVRLGMTAMQWEAKRNDPNWTRVPGKPHLRRGIGMAIAMHGSGVAGLDMGAAFIKMNDDGSFNLMVGATDLGTGADTVLAQIAAEVLGVPVDDVVVYASDTDFTPFDKGAYASSTTYVSGGAVRKAAQAVARQIREHAARMLGVEDPATLALRDRAVHAPDGRSVSLREVALSSLHQLQQHQIMAAASFSSAESPPPFAATFVELTVDIETGQVTIDRILMAVDAGRVINPVTASGQVEGGIQQGLGFVHTEVMAYDERGKLVNARPGPYYTYRAADMPDIQVVFVQTDEPTGPFGAKSVSEIPLDGVAPATVAALHHATGVWVRHIPLTPERVWRALRTAGVSA